MGKKNQHFVPQFYLRNFATDDRSLDLVVLTSGKVVRQASLRKQCYEKWFYGEDEKVENLLMGLEAEWSRVLRSVVETGKVPGPVSNDRAQLLMFVTFQRLRTAVAEIYINQIRDLMAKVVLKDHPEVDPQELETLKFGVKHAAVDALTHAPVIALSLDDLRVEAVQVDGPISLFTSDHPVVFYNQYCEGAKGVGVLGALSRGLQVFVPLTPRLLLMVFDAQIYRFGNRRGNERALSGADCHALNVMQVIGANKHVYIPRNIDENYVERVLGEAAPHRAERKVKVALAVEEEGGTSTQEGTRSELAHFHSEMPQLNLDLGMLRVRKSVAATPLSSRVLDYREQRRTVHAYERAMGCERDYARSDGPRTWKVTDPDWRLGGQPNDGSDKDAVKD